MKRARFASLSTANINRRPTEGDKTPQYRPVLTILSHYQCTRIGQRLLLPPRLRSLELSRTTPDFYAPGSSWGAPLDDPFLSRKPLTLHCRPNGALEIDPTTTSMEISIGGRRLHQGECLTREQLHAGVVLDLCGRLTLFLSLCREDLEDQREVTGLIGRSQAMRQLHRDIERVADLSVPVLLRGHTGTGKELVARALHQLGGNNRPFLAVNMAAIPTNLAASELFGAVSGAFTGAQRDRQGYFEQAHGGVLFLDEIGETPPELQAMLLRVLESGEILPLGASKPRKISVRLIAATDADLEALVADKQFKEPLLHRLAVFEIKLPALVERREDIGRLIVHFARAALAEIGEGHKLEADNPYAPPWLPADLMQRLLAFSWPGNVRQLQNVVRHLVIAHRGQPCLGLTDGILDLLEKDHAGRESPRDPGELDDQQLVEELRRRRYDLKATAAALGISRPTLYRRIDQSPILHRASDLSGETIAAAFQELDGDIEAMVDTLQISASALRRRIKELNLH